MNQKRKYKIYSKEFKEEAVALVTDQGYSVAEAAEAVGQVVYPCFYPYMFKFKVSYFATTDQHFIGNGNVTLTH